MQPVGYICKFCAVQLEIYINDKMMVMSMVVVNRFTCLLLQATTAGTIARATGPTTTLPVAFAKAPPLVTSRCRHTKSARKSSSSDRNRANNEKHLKWKLNAFLHFAVVFFLNIWYGNENEIHSCYRIVPIVVVTIEEILCIYLWELFTLFATEWQDSKTVITNSFIRDIAHAKFNLNSICCMIFKACCSGHILMR